MLGAEVNFHPIQLLVNYWEIHPSAMGAHLNELLRQGVTHMTSFIPWQAMESDISHSLTRFLQVAAERKMSVSLILSPEVGVHYPNSGLPKDVIAKQDNLGQHFHRSSVAVALPPNSFALPSLFSHEFGKRYNSFLSRIDSYLADLGRNQPELVRHLTLVHTGSFWKYYRSPLASSRLAFGGFGGDYSAGAALAYRQALEKFFGQREFLQPASTAANRWKSHAFEEVNRRWFYQQAEEIFRSRTFHMVRRKASNLKVREIELYTPEADPFLSYSQFLQMISGRGPDFTKLSSLVDETASRSSRGSCESAVPFIHWSSLGGFRGLSDSEKHYLLLKSLLLMGGQGGGILIDESEWFDLSQTFRAKIDAFARSISQGDLRLKNRALYLAPHLWSSSGTLWDELFRKVGPGARMVSSAEALTYERESRLLIVDPTFILTKESIQKLTAWAKAGRVVVLPRSPLYTDAARIELEQITSQGKRIEIDLGIPYHLHGWGDGKLIVYDLPENLSMHGETLASWQTFLTAILSVAEVEAYCRLGDSRLSVIPLERKGQDIGIFVLNGSHQQIAGDIIFPVKVTISDLAVSISAPSKTAVVKNLAARPAPATRFSLEVPPFGILPLSVDGLKSLEAEERQMAAALSVETQANVDDAAYSQFPGFSSQRSSEDLWN